MRALFLDDDSLARDLRREIARHIERIVRSRLGAARGSAAYGGPEPGAIFVGDATAADALSTRLAAMLARYEPQLRTPTVSAVETEDASMHFVIAGNVGGQRLQMEMVLSVDGRWEVR